MPDPERMWIEFRNPFVDIARDEKPGWGKHVEYARLDTLPAVRWTPGAPPEDMRDGRDVLVWAVFGHDKRTAIMEWDADDGYWCDEFVCVPSECILAWADPQPPEGVL